MDAARARKLADRIQQVVAEMLERRIKDPRLGFVTVTDARITADLRDATVFYTVFGSDAERADSAAALESAKGVIRSEVGRQTGLRHTPTLTFAHDPLPDSARHIDELLAEARAKDAEIAKKAEGARHAGEPDPYRKPEPAGDLDDELDELDGLGDELDDEFDGAASDGGRGADSSPGRSAR
jgi:ribosome-binding factor A